MSNYRLIDTKYNKTSKTVDIHIQVIGTSKYIVLDLDEAYEQLKKFSHRDSSSIVHLYLLKNDNNYEMLRSAALATSRENPQYLYIITALYSAFLILSNATVSKTIDFHGFIISGAAFVFPLTYIIGDIATEVYGFKIFRKILWMGFLANLTFVAGVYIVIQIPGSSLWTDQVCLEKIFSQSIRIFGASTIAYLVGEFLNSMILSKLKVLAGGKYFGLRSISSTFVGAAFDTAIFSLIAFAGVIPAWPLVILSFTEYGSKLLYELCVLPITIFTMRYLKRKEQMDVYDVEEKYDPFKI